MKHPNIINVKDETNGNVALHVAASKNNVPMLELLVRKGADIDIQDIFGNAPIHYAVDKERKETTQALIKHGVRINIQDYKGNSPLHNACATGNLEIVELLLRNGADPDMLDHSNAKPGDKTKNFEVLLAIEREQNRRKNGDTAAAKIVNWMGFGVGLGIGLGIALAKQQQFYADQARLAQERKKLEEELARKKRRDELEAVMGRKSQGSGSRKFIS